MTTANSETSGFSTSKHKACQGCHAAKVKCVRLSSSASGGNMSDACVRCRRLGIQCVPHVRRKSKVRQSRRPVVLPVPQMQQQQSQEQLQDDASYWSRLSKQHPPSKQLPEHDGVGQQHMATISAKQVCPYYRAATNTKTHYGLVHTIRMCMAHAAAHQDFLLLAKASTIAFQSGLSMDQTMNRPFPVWPSGSAASNMDTNSSIHKVLSRSASSSAKSMTDHPVATSSSSIVGPPFNLGEIPTNFVLQVCCCCQGLVGRWAWMHNYNMRTGQSRLFVSDCFHDDIATRQELETWLSMQHEQSGAPGILPEMILAKRLLEDPSFNMKAVAQQVAQFVDHPSEDERVVPPWEKAFPAANGDVDFLAKEFNVKMTKIPGEGGGVDVLEQDDADMMEYDDDLELLANAALRHDGAHCRRKPEEPTITLNVPLRLKKKMSDGKHTILHVEQRVAVWIRPKSEDVLYFHEYIRPNNIVGSPINLLDPWKLSDKQPDTTSPMILKYLTQLFTP